MEPKPDKIKEAILGRKYSLSVVFTDSKTIRSLNRKYRGKNAPTNVLSFPLSKDEGEIFINKIIAEKEAKKIGSTKKDYVDYLLIHSLLHLKGYKHGLKMDKEEERIMKKFKIWQGK